MGRSTTSCFKIITCGSDSIVNDDLQASESKGSSDKSGWSFRKRSARHRVLSNTVITETPSSGNKETPESATVNFQTQANSSVPEKTSAVQGIDEKPQLLTSVDTEVSETIVSRDDDTKVDVNLDESVLIVIQAAIRGFLAQRALLKLKNVVKLQAAVRGHLVRRHAVGTLRCVQAIVKMQALVRARRARLSVGGSCTEMKLDAKCGKDNESSKLLEKENSVAKSNITYTTIEKLLSNGFARQLLESTPRTKPIHIKCDPSRPDSAWIWLERWMSVSSTGAEQSPKPESSTEQQEQEKVEYSTRQVETIIPSESYCEATDLKTNNNGETAVPFEGEENLITHDADNFDFQACRPTSSSINDGLEQPQPENTETSNSKENALDSLPNQIAESNLIYQTELNSLSSKSEMESEQPKRCLKRFAPEQPETEGKKFVFGSRKASNPAFISAQSKFEELSSTANSARSISSSNQEVGVESNTDADSSAMDNAIRTKEIDLSENSVPHTSRLQVVGSELSISSTLDSPDRSELGAIEFEQEAKVSEGTSNIDSAKNLDVEAKGESTIPGSDVSYSITVQSEKLDDVNGADGKPVDSVIAVDSSQAKQKLEKNPSDVRIELDSEKNPSDVQIKLDSETGHQAYKSSPEASPRSHMTVPESQGTPSSQVSVKAKRTKSDKSGSNTKHRSFSAGKRPPANPIQDSGGRSSLEQLPKDHKSGKRRSSFGSSRPDHVDQEPRDSSSSNSLPNYMQATESARAKAQANSSPRSSPDVQDKDIYIKKRYSLPGANGRQGSPCIQRSMSQAHQGAKGNGAHPNERKWQR